MLLLLLFITLLLPPNADADAHPNATTTPDLDAFKKLNLTKRPLNFYIIANAKHAVVENKTLESENDGQLGVAVSKAAKKLLDYRSAKPPFSIKQRGAVLLLHNNTGHSMDWHSDYPSLIQMMAASGHLAIAPELITSHPMDPLRSKSRKSTNLLLMEHITRKENLTNIVVLAQGERSSQLALDFLQEEVVDGLMLIEPGDAIIEKLERKTKKGVEMPPIVIVCGGGDVAAQANETTTGKMSGRLGELSKQLKDSFTLRNPKSVHQQGDSSINKLAQLMVNFMDFLHPR